MLCNNHTLPLITYVCRSSWRVVSSIESKKEGEGMALVTSYKEKIESELNATCKEVLVSNLYYNYIPL